MKKIIVTVITIFLFTIPVYAGGEKDVESPEEIVNLTFWDMVWGPGDSYPQTSESIVRLFNETHPNIKVTLQLVDWTSWYEKFITAITSGSAPDIATSSSSAPFLFSSMDELVDLSPLLEKWKAEGTYDDILQSSYNAYNRNGIQAAIPWQVDSRCFFYRKDIFDKLELNPNPKDWNELLEILEDIRDNTDMIPLAISGADNMTKHLGYQLAICNDVGMVDKNMEADFLNPKWTEVLEFVNTLSVEKLISPGTVGYSNEEAQSLYFSGKAAVLFTEVNPDIYSYPEVAENSGILGTFTGPDSDTKRTVSFVNPIMVFKQSKASEEAMVFVDWWSRNNLPLFIEGKASAMPTRFSQLKDPYYSSLWLWAEAREKIIPHAVIGGLYPVFSEFPGFSAMNGERMAGQVIQKVLLAEGDPDYDKIQHEMNDAVNQALKDAAR